MHLIVGLGNPGPKYLLTRHNAGFLALDTFLAGQSVPTKTEHDAVTTRFKLEGKEVIFAKPQTFMNNSGESVSKLVNFYKIEIQNLLVIHDEVDLPFTHMKFVFDRGPGGQNGVKSIHEHLGTAAYARLRLGIGRSLNPHMDTAAHVLSPFSEEEQTRLHGFLDKACDGIETFINEGISRASTLFNG